MDFWARHFRFLQVLAAFLALGVSAPSCTKTKRRKKAGTGGKAMAAEVAPQPAGAIHWKGVLMTGDDSIVAFDNARKRLKETWIARGVQEADIRELSMARSEQGDGVRASSTAGLKKALTSLKVGKGDGCLVHLTSHGSPWGFYLRTEGMLSPTTLNKVLTETCGDRPTLVFVSACYSGVFTGNVMKRPNRAVLTAARDDRNSFGCGVEDTFTYWDGCVIDALPDARTVPALTSSIDACIRDKERGKKLFHSYPQAVVGAGMKRVPLFDAAVLEAE